MAHFDMQERLIKKLYYETPAETPGYQKPADLTVPNDCT
jgi:hypothetical protein